MTLRQEPKKIQVVLASSSKYRRLLLARICPAFRVEIPAINESSKPDEDAYKLVQRLAKEKAYAVMSRCEGLLIGSDQVGVVNDTILTKPASQQHAVEQLTLMSGKEVKFHTAVHLIDTHSGRETSHVDTTTLVFRSLEKQNIENYIELEQPYQSCGSFQIEGHGIALIDKITATDPNALIGLPLIWLYNAMQNFGYDFLA